MNAKPEVIYQGASFEIGYALGVADALHRALFGKPATVTSIKDGKHSDLSLHYQGQAADLRTKDLSRADSVRWYTLLREHLEPCGFDVVDEPLKNHIHIEFQIKAGETFLVRVP